MCRLFRLDFRFTGGSIFRFAQVEEQPVPKINIDGAAICFSCRRCNLCHAAIQTDAAAAQLLAKVWTEMK